MHFNFWQDILFPLLLTIALIPGFIYIHKKFHLIEKRNHRKIHISDTPTMAGLPMLIAFVVTVLINSELRQLTELKFILLSLVMMSALGLYDDIMEIGAKRKLFFQVFVISFLVYMSKILIPGIYGFNLISEWSLPVSLLVSIAFIVIVTNIFNLIDGSDGLAGVLGIVYFSFFALWFIFIDEKPTGIAFVGLISVLIGFLFYNWYPAKTFMGDTGALWLGTLIGISTIAFMNSNASLVEPGKFHFNGTIGSTLAILFIPIFDTVRVVIIRLLQKQSIFKADLNHTHHHLLRFGLSQRKVALLLGFINLLMICLAVLFRELPDKYLIPLVLFLGIQLSLVISFFSLKQELSEKGLRNPGLRDILKSSRKAS